MTDSISDSRRLTWTSDLTPGPDEPLAVSLIRYRMDQDRWPDPEGNLVSSHVVDSDRHAPILDLDIPHHYVRSTSDGHGHLYLDFEMPKWRMMLMLWALKIAGVIEPGNLWWSLRRGGTFVRRPEVPKFPQEQLTYSYGMFFKLKGNRDGRP